METFVKKLSTKELNSLHSCCLCNTTKYLVIRKLDYERKFQVECTNCKCGGPVERTRLEAVELWNVMM